MNPSIMVLNSIAVSFFGSILSAAFSQALDTPRNRRIFFCCMIAIALLQGWLYSFRDIEFLREIYPLLVHLPLLLLLCFLTKRLLWSVISILTAYLCCQLRRWLALVSVALLSGDVMLQHFIELIATLPLLLLLLRFVAPAVRPLAAYPVKLQCQFGAIPALYYVFDYATTVYTDLLTAGSPVIVEFMPFVCCCAYLAFLLYHSAEERRYSQLQQAQKTLDIQLKQSVREINTLRESQELARRYRHDLRHHLQYISACIENGQLAQAQSYISGISKEIEAQKVRRYCENEAANLILSSFDARAKKEGIEMAIEGMLPASTPLSESDLCILFSNALENALHACQPFAAVDIPCRIDVRFYEKMHKFFLQVSNPCAEEVQFENGIPVSEQPGHGIGVQSICAVVEKYGGVCSFSLKEGQFILRLSI